jgi:hypothetical protein
MATGGFRWSVRRFAAGANLTPTLSPRERGEREELRRRRLARRLGEGQGARRVRLG